MLERRALKRLLTFYWLQSTSRLILAMISMSLPVESGSPMRDLRMVKTRLTMRVSSKGNRKRLWKVLFAKNLKDFFPEIIADRSPSPLALVRYKLRLLYDSCTNFIRTGVFDRIPHSEIDSFVKARRFFLKNALFQHFDVFPLLNKEKWNSSSFDFTQLLIAAHRPQRVKGEADPHAPFFHLKLTFLTADYRRSTVVCENKTCESLDWTRLDLFTRWRIYWQAAIFGSETGSRRTGNQITSFVRNYFFLAEMVLRRNWFLSKRH